jgi:pimeloyl-ACP methyl ester carboxylesterase
MREFWTEMVKTDPRVRLSDILAYRRSDMSGRLKTLKRPALVVQGGADQLCARGKADELVSGIEVARLALIEGAGNVAHLEKSGEVNQAIDAFLTQL